VNQRETNDLLAALIEEMRGLRADLRADSKPDNALVTMTAFAAELGIDVRTLRRMKASGDLPKAVQIGTHPRWRRVDVDKWLLARKASQ
jgi:predicted DNA-binding transcriptional regulator AlpA